MDRNCECCGGALGAATHRAQQCPACRREEMRRDGWITPLASGAYDYTPLLAGRCPNHPDGLVRPVHQLDTDAGETAVACPSGCTFVIRREEVLAGVEPVFTTAVRDRGVTHAYRIPQHHPERA